MIREGKLKINNVPPYSMVGPYPYWLCTIDENGEAWFYGAYRTRERTEQAKREGTWSTPTIIVERISDES